MNLSSLGIAPSLGQRPVKARHEARVTFKAGQEDNDIRRCRQWLEDNPDPAEGRVPAAFPYVSFLRTMSEDGEEITNVLPVLPESERWWLNIPILVLGLARAASDLPVWPMLCVKIWFM